MNTSCQIAVIREMETIKHFSIIKERKICDAILVLSTINRDIRNILYRYCQHLGINTNFVIVDMEDVTEELLNDFSLNLIIIASKGIDIRKFKNSLRAPLIWDLKGDNPNAIREPLLERVLISAANSSTQTEQSLYPFSQFAYQRVKNPLDLVYLSADELIDYLPLVLNDLKTNLATFKSSVSFFKGKSLNEIRHWQEMIKNDIYFLQAERKLTSRLARLIYKVATLNDEMSDTAIGTFFRKSLGVKSKALYNKHFGISNVKGYDLCVPQVVHNPKFVLTTPYAQF